MPHPATLPITQLLKNCSIQNTRRGGPGGQHRNKVETAVIVRHDPSGVIGQASERREQLGNRLVAIHRLRVRLALAVRSPSELAEENRRCGELWSKYIRSGRLSINPNNEDFPSLLAHALDSLFEARGDANHLAVQLKISPTQVIKFLKTEPAALELVNQWRQQVEERPFR